MIVPQRSRIKKSSNASSKSRRRNSLTNAVPLEPIFEHADMSPLEEYMSDTILKRIRGGEVDDGTCSDSSSSEELSEEGSSSSSSSSSSSQFQIITDNASSHPEFIVRQSRTTHSNSNSNGKSPQQLQKQQQQLPQMPTCRWGNGDCVHPNKISNDSNTSINTASTSSLSIWLNDCDEDEDDDSEGDASVDSFTNEPSSNTNSNANSNNTMTSTQIIQKATDVVAGKYDYNTHHIPTNHTTNHHSHGGSTRRRQARRSSMPLMPIRQESISHDLGQPPSGLPPPPLRPSKNVRSTSLTSSPPASSQPLDWSQYRDSSVPVDKFGIPVRFGTSDTSNHNSNHSSSNHSGHSRRRSRRSSMPSRADEVVSPPPVSSTEVWLRNSEPKKVQQVDKFGIPLTQELPLESSSAHGHRRTGPRRHGRRSSLGDKPSSVVASKEDLKVDKFGIPLTQGMPLESSSAHGTRCTGPRRHGRRSSMGDQPSPKEELKVDKYGIPLTTKDSTSAPLGAGRRRQGRRSSMPTTTTTTASTTTTTTRSVTFDLPLEEEEVEVPLAPESGSVPVDKFGIPIWPTEMRNSSSSSGRRRRKPRRSSLPTTGTVSSSDASPVLTDKYGVPVTASSSSSGSKSNRSGRRGRRSSMPRQFSPTSTANFPSANGSNSSTANASLSAMRFLSEELQKGNPLAMHHLRRNTTAPLKKKKDFLAPANGAPIRPERVPSVDSFAPPTTKKSSVVAATAQPNASFDVKKKINHKKLESILKGSSNATSTSSSSKKTTGSISSSDVSVNSMQQKDGEWWW